MNNIFVFVEGSFDRLFINKLFGEKLSLLGSNYILVEYANMRKKKIKSYINTINKMQDSDYIFLSDQDGNLQKKDKILTTYPFLNQDRVFISVYEIESWIISGVSEKFGKKYKIKPFGDDSSKVTKEIFDNLIPENFNKFDFIAYIVDDYDIDGAIEVNESLKEFFCYLRNKKAS